MNRPCVGFCLTLSVVLAACSARNDAPPSNDWKVQDREDMASADTLDMRELEDTAAFPRCGDGVVNSDKETCDGDCPTSITSCDPPPPEACARVTFTGSPDQCSAQCAYFQQTACISDDGCCPEGCDNLSDNDCGNCGDGILDDDELCDGNCYQSADECPSSPDTCSPAKLEGNADQCNVVCTYNTISTCADDDGCCPQGCEGMDNDCEPAMVCGDDITQGAETCDGDCPTSDEDCDDLNACTTDAVMGDATTCSAQCSATFLTSCTDDDGCCVPGCTGMDNDCDELDLCGEILDLQLSQSPTSVINVLELGDDAVGFDYNGDAIIDNAFGAAFVQFGAQLGLSVSDFNAALAQRIDDGSSALVLEYDGLRRLLGPEAFELHMLDGFPQCFTTPDPDGTNIYRISTESYGRKTALPISSFGQASLSTSQVQATGISIRLELDLLGAPLDLEINTPRLQAHVNAAQSGLPSRGVALSQGTIGGYITARHFFDALNTYISSCNCAVRPTGVALFDYTPSGDVNCSEGFEALQCTQSDAETACATIINSCNLLSGVIPALSDVDDRQPGMDCQTDGTCNSMSIGFRFSAAGARQAGFERP